ncbi:MAG: Ig-like domain-containing protein [candidate division WOR-3 bacterium]
MSRSHVWLVLISTLLLACAKKMLPPSPDRFPPHLTEVNPRTRVQVELLFDEPVAADKIPTESLRLATRTGEAVTIRGLSQGRSGDRILLWTEPLEKREYLLKGVASDPAGNIGRFVCRFSGSPRADTVPPRISGVQPTPGSAGLKRGVRISVRFSEPVDTCAQVRWLFAPIGSETLFSRRWGIDWQELAFVRRDSLEPGSIFYFILEPGIPDLEGNRCRTPAWTYFAPDSSLDGVTVHGRARWKAGPLGTGVVLFFRERTLAMAPVLSDGSWTTRVKAGEWTVQALADTNWDGIVDLAGYETTFLTAGESLDIILHPDASQKPLDAYLR